MAYNPNNPNGQATSANSAPVVIASDQSPVPISGTINATVTTTASSDVLGTTIVGGKNNQIEISFQGAPDVNLITNTTSGGATITQANGHTLYSTGTATTSAAKGVSVQITDYRPAHEIYAYFTAAFTTPTSASSYQNIGLYDSNNGFFIGYNGLTFGVTKRTSGVDTFTSSSSFNGDLLNGGVNSKFTRSGSPEAINLNYSNLFRIRFAWLGSASILFDVFSPDGSWVNFHTIRQPNSSLNPSIATPNLPMTIDVSKTSADSTNLIMYTACWAAGTTSDLDNLTATLTDYTLASLSRSVITGRTTGGGGGYVNVKVTPSGSLTTAIGDISGVVGQNTMANSLPVTIASNQTAVPASQFGTWNINNISGTVSLPTGAATSANQTTGNTSLSSIDGKLGTLGQKVMTGSAPVVIASDQSAVPVSGSLSVSNLQVITLGQATMANSLPVTIASNQSTMPVTQAGRTAVDRARIDYSVTSVTTSAYVQLKSSLAATCNEVEIFDSSGQTLILATGAASSEVDQIYVFPGGNGRVPLIISSGTRVSIKAVSATANSGEISINFYS